MVLDRMPRWTRTTAALWAGVVYETTVVVAMIDEGLEAALVVAWFAPLAGIAALGVLAVARRQH